MALKGRIQHVAKLIIQQKKAVDTHEHLASTLVTAAEEYGNLAQILANKRRRCGISERQSVHSGYILTLRSQRKLNAMASIQRFGSSVYRGLWRLRVELDSHIDLTIVSIGLRNELEG